MGGAGRLMRREMTATQPRDMTQKPGKIVIGARIRLFQPGSRAEVSSASTISAGLGRKSRGLPWAYTGSA